LIGLTWSSSFFFYVFSNLFSNGSLCWQQVPTLRMRLLRPSLRWSKNGHGEVLAIPNNGSLDN
jgi:hypothetical protein